METSPTYKMVVDCSNCGLSKKEIEIQKGKTVDQAECPECGNVTLSKHVEVVLDNYY